MTTAVSPLKYGAGIVCMIVCVVGWVSSRFLIQKINLVYPKPYLLSYLANSSRVLYFIIILIWGDFLIEKRTDEEEQLDETPRWKNSLKIAAWMTPLQGLLTFCNQMTFSTLSVSTGSILFNSNPVFLIGIGWSLGWEQLTLFKILAAVIAASSLILLASKEVSSEGHLGWQGVLAALGSALSFALISLLLKRQVMDLKRASMIEAYGWVGLLIMLIGAPIVVILHYTGWEPFEWPTWQVTPLIIANSLVGTFAFNLTWLMAFAWTSELVVAIGMGLALPLTFLVDMLVNHEHIGWIKWTSLVISLTAFILINIATRRPQWDYKIF